MVRFGFVMDKIRWREREHIIELKISILGRAKGRVIADRLEGGRYNEKKD